MSSSQVDPLVLLAYRRAERLPDFVATLIARWRASFDDAPATVLHVDESTILELGLCKRPRPETWNADVGEIAEAIGIDLDDLASFLRAAEVVERFGDVHAADEYEDGRLLAARDRDQEDQGGNE